MSDEAKRKAFAVLQEKIAELEAILEKGPPKPPTEKSPVTNGN